MNTFGEKVIRSAVRLVADRAGPGLAARRAAGRPAAPRGRACAARYPRRPAIACPADGDRRRWRRWAGARRWSGSSSCPQALHGDDPRFAPPVLAWERYRLDRAATRTSSAATPASSSPGAAGEPVGRIAAHVAGRRGGEGRFGFWVDRRRRRRWPPRSSTRRRGLAAASRAADSMTGPWSFEPRATSPASSSTGYDAAGTTGRPWRPAVGGGPPRGALGGAEVASTSGRTWRLPTHRGRAGAAPPAARRPGRPGRYARPAARARRRSPPCPTCPARSARPGSRSAWGLAQRARDGRLGGLHRRALRRRPRGRGARAARARPGRAGLPLGGRRRGHPTRRAPPETVHRTYRLSWRAGRSAGGGGVDDPDDLVGPHVACRGTSSPAPTRASASRFASPSTVTSDQPGPGDAGEGQRHPRVGVVAASGPRSSPRGGPGRRRAPAEPGNSEAMWPSGPRPRWTTSSRPSSPRRSWYGSAPSSQNIG